MSALPPSQMAAMREAASEAHGPNAALQARWHAIHQQADVVAGLAGLAPERPGTELAAFPILLAEAEDRQRAIALRGLEDVAALMQIGLSALAQVTQRGHDATAPALALWREFFHARNAVLTALLPQTEAA